jgi:hypothetical protein
LAAQARRLAVAARVNLLAVHFAICGGEERFINADPLPDLSAPLVADAVLEYMTESYRHARTA